MNYTFNVSFTYNGGEERSFQSLAELDTLRLYVTKKQKKKIRTCLFGNRLQFFLLNLYLHLIIKSFPTEYVKTTYFQRLVEMTSPEEPE